VSFRHGGPAGSLTVLAVMSWVGGCARHSPNVPEALVIAPFENLSGDPALDWAGRAIAHQVALQLASSARYQLTVAQGVLATAGPGAARVIEGYYYLEGGRPRVYAVLEDFPGSRTEAAAAALGTIPAAAASIAQKLDSGARPAPTGNETALRAYVEGLYAPDREQAAAQFERALAADPGFGPAYMAWCERLLASGDRAGAERVIAKAEVQRAAFGAVEQAQLDVRSASLRGDAARERRALAALAAATPADPSAYVRLAELAVAAREFPPAVAALEQALARAPGNELVLNQLGYARAYEGDLEGAASALNRYRELRPREANPLDSLGDVQYMSGRFAEAEKNYLAAYQKDPSSLGGGDLHKAAWARAMAGDLAGADQHFSRFAAARREAPGGFREAEWQFLTGRRKQGMEAMERIARSAPPQAAAAAWAQLAIWSLAEGDAVRARSFAEKASGPVGAMARLMAGTPVPAAEWEARARAAFPDPSQQALREYALANALVLSKEFAAAIPRLEAISQRMPPANPDGLDVLLAWAYLETGRVELAAPLLRDNPLPDPVGQHPLFALSFPRLFQLRAAVAARQGRTQEAATASALFNQFSNK
jgi:tetratricopeptide (TPR) repeat protein